MWYTIAIALLVSLSVQKAKRHWQHALPPVLIPLCPSSIMTRLAVSVAVASTVFALQTIGNPAGGVVYLRPRHQALPCDAYSFASALPPNATIEKVASVPEGGSYGEGAPD